MNTCDTCKFWSAEGYCTPNPKDHHRCNNLKLSNSLDEIDGLSANTSDPSYDITTGPKFGCIHWEAK
jgi:hypothetical protein